MNNNDLGGRYFYYLSGYKQRAFKKSNGPLIAYSSPAAFEKHIFAINN